MSSVTYTLQYEFCEIGKVKIDHEKADQEIKESVEFWSDWRQDLKEAKGNYTTCFLKNLALLLLRNINTPILEVIRKEVVMYEGYPALDGSSGIELLEFEPHEFERLMVEIVEEGEKNDGA